MAREVTGDLFADLLAAEADPPACSAPAPPAPDAGELTIRGILRLEELRRRRR